MTTHTCHTHHWLKALIPALLIALAMAAAPPAAQADLGSALKKAGEGLKKGTEDLKDSIENTRDRHITQPTTPDEMAKAADQQLKDAQALMFKGERDKAKAGLIEAAEMILALKDAAPEHDKLTGLTNRANKMAGDIKRRTGEELDIWGEAKKVSETEEEGSQSGETAKDDAKEEPAASTAAAAAPALPYHADQAMKEFDKQMRSVESSHKFIETYKEMGEPASKWLTKLDEAEAKIEVAKNHLADARAKAAEKDVKSHPAFDAAEAKIAAETKRIETARAEAKTAQAGAAASKAGVEADVDAFVDEYERLRETYFSKFPGTATYANDLEPIEEVIALIEKFEKTELEKAKQTLKTFTDKYGKTLDDVRAKVEAAGYTGQKQPEFKVELFQEGLDNAAKQRAAEFASILERIDLILNNIASVGDLVRLKNHDIARQWGQLAQRADPARGPAAVAALEAKLSADKDAFMKKIEAKEWPGNSTGKDAEAALTYFRESEDWAKRPTEPRRVLGVAVRGDWSVQKRNLAGNPTMHGLPVWIAVQVDSEKDAGLARVYNVTMRTPESANSQPEPPFTSITVGDSWYVMADKVK